MLKYVRHATLFILENKELSTLRVELISSVKNTENKHRQRLFDKLTSYQLFI